MYFCHGVACEYVGVCGNRSRIANMVGFWGGPKCEINVHCFKGYTALGKLMRDALWAFLSTQTPS